MNYYDAIGEQLVLGGAVFRSCRANKLYMRISCINAFWQHCRGIQDNTSLYLLTAGHVPSQVIIMIIWWAVVGCLRVLAYTYSLINALERQCPLSPPDWMADASLIAADLKWDEWVGGCWLFYLLVHSFTLFVSGPELKCMSLKCCL